MSNAVSVVVHMRSLPAVYTMTREVACHDALRIATVLSEESPACQVSILYGKVIVVKLLNGFVREVKNVRFQSCNHELDALELSEMLDNADVAMCLHHVLWSSSENIS